MMLPRVRLLGFALVLIAPGAVAAAGDPQTAPQEQTAVTPAAAGSAAMGSLTYDGPPPPVPPAVITRDDRGNATVRAIRISRPLEIDGRLDEEIYAATLGAEGFIQQDPHEGEPATERTEAWVFFDDKNIYVSARCWDPNPERWVVNELRRDSNVITQNEHFAVMFDTFHDKRNGFFFQTNPLSALRDQIFTDEGNANSNWNTVWVVKAERFDGGWSAEMAIPFKSLRYIGSGPQVWGINFRRGIRYKNEEVYLTRMNPAWGGNAAFHASAYGTLVGLETPAQSMNLEVKPYVATTLTTDRVAEDPFANRWNGDAGFDFKYGLTRSLIADATVNTDFAQVEEDLQQVNLTRFSLFFPEKRDFFLEGQGNFVFGAAVGAAAQNSTSDVPILFFSRRVGLSRGQAVPIIAGGRLSGTVDKVAIGALNIQTADMASAGAVTTNFSVLRLKRSILRRSNVGFILTNRSPTIGGASSNQVFGADANFAFYRNVSLGSYYARTYTDLGQDGSSYRGRFEYAHDRYGLSGDHLMVGKGFNPEVGFLRRTDFRRSTVTARFSPRPAGSALVRKYTWDANYDYITDSANTRVENRQTQGNFRIEFNSSDMWNVTFTDDYEFLPNDFAISPGVVIPTGGYSYQTVQTGYTLGQQRRVSGSMRFQTGSFYDGTRQGLSFSGGRITVTPRVIVEPGITVDWVDVPEGSFTTELYTTRVTFTPSPRSLMSGLLQYNANDRTLSASVRLRWEYTAGSELFVVYSDNRNTFEPDPLVRNSRLLNRSFAIKITRLVRF
jgi:hypothetical protein